MSQKKKQDEKEPEVVEAPKAPAPAFKPAAPKVAFARWANDRGIKESHRRGRLAYVKNPEIPRTLAEWDELFKEY